jgi:hypothetical protein
VTESTAGEGDGTWVALRHRKVGQWGIACVAVAPGLLQEREYASNPPDVETIPPVRAA